MLYFIQIVIMLVWVGWLLKTKRVCWSAFVNIYVLTLFVVDVIEICFNLLLGYYKFPAHIFSDPVKDNFLGILCADSVILPLTAIIFCYHVKNHPWKTSFVFAVVMFFLEWLYLRFGYLRYYKWTILYSALAYIIGFSIFSRFANSFIYRPFKVPYFIRITCFAYAVLVLPGAIPDTLLHLHYWHPGIVTDLWSDDRITDLGSCLIIAIVIGIIIPRTTTKYKLPTFTVLAIWTVLFGLFSFWQGWLIYNRWNHYLTFIRYVIPFVVLFWYDKWQAKKAPYDFGKF
jgi:hypothetical protein